MTVHGARKDELRPYMTVHERIGRRADLQPVDKLTWGALVDCLPRGPNAADSTAPRLATLAEKVHLSQRQIRRSLRRLEAAGLIESEAQLGRQTSYAIFEPPPIPTSTPDLPGIEEPRTASPPPPGLPVRGTPDSESAPPRTGCPPRQNPNKTGRNPGAPR